MISRRFSLCLCVLVSLCLIPYRALPQSSPTVKLYIFDCGNLKSGNPDVLTARGLLPDWWYTLKERVDRGDL